MIDYDTVFSWLTTFEGVMGMVCIILFLLIMKEGIDKFNLNVFPFLFVGLMFIVMVNFVGESEATVYEGEEIEIDMNSGVEYDNVYCNSYP